MNEIICPNCHKAFKVDEAGFADIVKQVRDHQFEEELANRLDLAEKEKESAVKLALADLRGSLEKELAQKDKLLTEQLAAKELELSQMQSKIQNAETTKQLEISDALESIEKERDALIHDLKTKEAEKESAVKLAEATIKSALEKELAQKDRLLSELKAQSDTELAEKLAAKELELSQMKSQITHAQTQKKLEISEATKEIESSDVVVKAPNIATGAVPITIQTSIKAKSVSLFQDANPESAVATWSVPEGGIVDYRLKIKLKQTKKPAVVSVVVEGLDGKFYTAHTSVTVAGATCDG
ncbi:hypothetical protein C9926_01855 [Sulfurovum lithotrophicum]|nr:hypothetical protein C9926_01855 [Sulfurovum lithotrophicum]